MSKTFNTGVLAVLAVVTVLATSSVAVHAQSSSRGRMRKAPGSNSRSPAGSRQAFALSGYCSVCIIEKKKWVKGDPNFRVDYDGHAYLFPGEKQRQMFLANPAKYVPALGGDCTVCFAKMGKRMPGSVYHSAFYQQRLFLFPSDEQKSMFREAPSSFADVDLALGGNCSVCLVEMQKEVPGKPEFTVVYEGLRYLFPSAKQRDMFVANPTKYAAGPQQLEQQTSVIKPLALDAEVVHVTGTSGCAACDHGVHPLGATDTLGLAVNSEAGDVYVVEDADTLYKEIYDNRFEGLSLEVTGKVLKREGKFVWLKPESLKQL